MTLMLASVTSPAEAEAVCGRRRRHHRSEGSGEWRARRARCHGRGGHRSRGRQTQAGERRRRQLAGRAGGLSSTAVAAMAASGVDYVKIGFSPERAGADCVRALAPQAKNTKLVGVLFADCAPDLDLLRLMASNGFTGAMLDTAKKGAGRLLDHMDIAALDGFIGQCRENRLMAGLAGSLEAPDVPRLLPLEPDYLGFRGSLCHGRMREGEIDPASVRMIRDLIPREAEGGTCATSRGSIGASIWGAAISRPMSALSRRI